MIFYCLHLTWCMWKYLSMDGLKSFYNFLSMFWKLFYLFWHLNGNSWNLMAHLHPFLRHHRISLWKWINLQLELKLVLAFIFFRFCKVELPNMAIFFRLLVAPYRLFRNWGNFMNKTESHLFDSYRMNNCAILSCQ